MRKRRRCWFCTVILMLCCVFIFTQVAFGAIGKIAVRVIDAETNESLLGANILIEGTMVGAASDGEGNFFIFVPPGIYNLKAKMIGYDLFVLTNLRANNSYNLGKEGRIRNHA